MTPPFFYCSLMSRDAAELSCGTASLGEVWFLVEYPYPWGPRAMEDSGLPLAVKRHLVAATKQVPHSRVLLIKQESAPRDFLRLFVVRSRERDPFIARMRLDSYQQVLSVDLAAMASGTSETGVVTRDPLWLICTHGRRDKCCAKFGYTLYKSLRAARGDAIWQSSHVGGDRFAANLVAFPHGLFYGHVDNDGGAAIIREYEQQRVALDGYRGRSCYAHAVQAAEFFVRKESGLARLDELHFRRRQRTGEREWRVQFETPAGMTHEALISGHPSAFQTYITCHATEEQKVIQYRLDGYRITTPDTIES